MRAFILAALAALSANTAWATPVDNSGARVLRRDEESLTACYGDCNTQFLEGTIDEAGWQTCLDDCLDAEAAGDCDADDVADKDELNDCLEDCAEEYEDDEEGLAECEAECTNDFCETEIFDKRK